MIFLPTLRRVGFVSACGFALSCGQTDRDFAESNGSAGALAPKPVAGASNSGGRAGSSSDTGAGGEGAAAAGGASAGDGPRDPSAGAPTEPEPEPTPEPPVSDCARRIENHSDQNTGQSWSSVWYCGNDAAAHLYQTPSYSAHVATMDSITSWFVCYRHGQAHAGNNDVWYYTQGDRSTAGWGSRAGWGYMAAVNVHTRNDPNPGIPECAVE